MYAVVECSKELKNKRYLDGVELNFVKEEKSIVVKNVNNLELFITISEHYEDEFKDYITKIVKNNELVIIFLDGELILDIAKQLLFYKIDDKHDDSYYLELELKKWIE
jgi:hypothetical protein